MRTSEFEEVKKWLRGLRISVKTLNLKIDFYNDLIDISDNSKSSRTSLDIDYYRKEIKGIENEIKHRAKLFDRCLSILDESEKNIITLKYMKGIGWDYIPLNTYYSKTQAVRIHNSAIKKIVKDKELCHKLISEER